MKVRVVGTIAVRPRVLWEGENVVFVHSCSGVFRWPLAGILPICRKSHVRMEGTVRGAGLESP